MTVPTPVTNYYCQVADVADFLRVTINRTTIPNDIQVAKIIQRKEQEIERRCMNAWRSIQVTEIYNLPMIYSYGWGQPIFLKHRNLFNLDSTQGDSINVWDGTSYGSIGTLSGNFGNTYNLDAEYGRLFIRGYIFTIIRDYRVQITYRYGNSTVPADISDAVIKMTAIDLLTTSFKADQFAVGSGFGLEWEKVIDTWRGDIERTIWDRTEITMVS